MRPTPLRRTLALTALLGCALATSGLLPGAAAAPRDPKVQCTGDPTVTRTVSLPMTAERSPLTGTAGNAVALYAVPRGTPRGLVLFDHGYGHTMRSWERHVLRTARELGVIAVAPNYRFQRDDLTAKPLPSSRGWRVAEGAEDTIALAQLFHRACRLTTVSVLHSVSMGGNTAGLALAERPVAPDGSPLFDAWVDVEGAANVTETYLAAKALAPANAFAQQATEDIEEAFGGTPAEVPAVYAERTVVNRVPDIAASGVRGVVMVHGVADGLVSHDISRQLQVLLLAQGVPVDMTAFVTRSPGSEPGTTVDGYVPTGQTSPFAGHASEASETHDVGNAGFAALARVVERNGAVSCEEKVVDGNVPLRPVLRVRC